MCEVHNGQRRRENGATNNVMIRISGFAMFRREVGNHYKLSNAS